MSFYWRSYKKGLTKSMFIRVACRVQREPWHRTKRDILYDLLYNYYYYSLILIKCCDQRSNFHWFLTSCPADFFDIQGIHKEHEESIFPPYSLNNRIFICVLSL